VAAFINRACLKRLLEGPGKPITYDRVQITVSARVTARIKSSLRFLTCSRMASQPVNLTDSELAPSDGEPDSPVWLFRDLTFDSLGISVSAIESQFVPAKRNGCSL